MRKRKKNEPLMLWRHDTQEWVYWPTRRLRFYGYAHEILNMKGLIYAEYGPFADLMVYRARIAANKSVIDYTFVGNIDKPCSNTMLMGGI